jgi:hypothetical protein
MHVRLKIDSHHQFRRCVQTSQIQALPILVPRSFMKPQACCALGSALALMYLIIFCVCIRFRGASRLGQYSDDSRVQRGATIVLPDDRKALNFNPQRISILRHQDITQAAVELTPNHPLSLIQLPHSMYWDPRTSSKRNLHLNHRHILRASDRS